MTALEFSSEFDILYDNIMSNQAPGLTEYEKSVFLTQAQEQVVLGIYKGTFDGDSFESTEEAKSYLSDLVVQKTYSNEDISRNSDSSISDKSYTVDRMEDAWVVLYESAEIKDDSVLCLKDGKWVTVVSSTLDEFNRIKNNPFRGPNKRNVLRLSIGDKYELISEYDINQYKIRYLKRPYPIILDYLSEASINGQYAPYGENSPCELHPSLHKSILNTAVSIAKAMWSAKS